MSLACKSWNLIVIGALKQVSLVNMIFLSITGAKACWKEILHIAWKTGCKKMRINNLSIVYCGKNKHILLMKWSISRFMCAMHLRGHWNKMVPFMKRFILVDLSNGLKFHSYTCWLTNDTHNHRLLCWVHNYHIDNKNLILTSHVEIHIKIKKELFTLA
jgi:hypothetical protein